jgi:sugar phosphate permease
MSSNKYLVFISTLLGYSVVHIQRMTLPFVQLNLMNFFNIHKLQMGIANATLYIILGLSYLWIALRPIKNPQFTYLWTMTISSLFFLVTPLLVYLHLPIPAVFYLSLAAFGLFQSPAWPIMLQIIHIYFRPR